MSEPNIARKKPYMVKVEAGEYWWCACGLSKKQPYCDGSHKGGDFTPVKVTLDAGVYYLCGCKHTRNPPYCDGTHKDL